MKIKIFNKNSPALLLPRTDLFLHWARQAKLEKSEQIKIVSEVFPLPEDQLVWECVSSEKNQASLLIAVSRQRLSGLHPRASQNGLIGGIGAGFAAALAKAINNPDFNSEEASLFLDRRLTQTELMVTRFGFPLFVQTLSVGSDDKDGLVKAIQESINFVQESWALTQPPAFLWTYSNQHETRKLPFWISPPINTQK